MAIAKIHLTRFMLLSALYLGAGTALAQTAAGTAPAPAPSAATAGGTATPPALPAGSGSGSDLRHAHRAGEQFGAFAGSRENTEALALALRRGSEVTLVGADGKTTRFTPATGHMGHGNVTKSMALAQRQLAAAGIGNPTPEQVKAALNGGTVTVGSGADARTVEMQGILKLRSQGMGWGRIAHTVGVKPGHGFKPTPVASGGTGVTNALGGAQRVRFEERTRTRERMVDASGNEVRTRSETRSRSEFRTGDDAWHGGGRGVVTAGGGGGRHGAHHTGGGEAPEVESGIHQHRGGRGMVNAAGGAPAPQPGEARLHNGGGAEAMHRQGGRAPGSGIVTATGAPAAGARPMRSGEFEVHRSGGSHGGGGRGAGSAIASAAGGSTAVASAAPVSGGGQGRGRGHGGGKN